MSFFIWNEDREYEHFTQSTAEDFGRVKQIIFQSELSYKRLYNTYVFIIFYLHV